MGEATFVGGELEMYNVYRGEIDLNLYATIKKKYDTELSPVDRILKYRILYDFHTNLYLTLMK